MPKQVQLRRGTTAQTATFTGALGEATVDTTKKTLVVHDGTTAGGSPLSREADLTTLTSRVGAFGTVTRLSDGAITINTLVKVGSDAAHVTPVAANYSGPAYGVALNATSGAGQSVSVAVLCLARELVVKMVADAAIVAGVFVEPSQTNAGYAHTLSGFVGTHLVVGVAMSGAAVLGDLIDVAPCLFQRVI